MFAQEGNIRFQPAAVPDDQNAAGNIYPTGKFSPVHHQALEACALVRLTMRQLLAHARRARRS